MLRLACTLGNARFVVTATRKQPVEVEVEDREVPGFAVHAAFVTKPEVLFTFSSFIQRPDCVAEVAMNLGRGRVASQVDSRVTIPALLCMKPMPLAFCFKVLPIHLCPDRAAGNAERGTDLLGVAACHLEGTRCWFVIDLSYRQEHVVGAEVDVDDRHDWQF